MNDWELFEAMNEAEKQFIELQNEFRKRGLHNKPLIEYSRKTTSFSLSGTFEWVCKNCLPDAHNPKNCAHCGKSRD